ncbi:MAG TPA: DUF2490 domain-containing protein [Ginsengibacter sp.]|nr:DUF2490 domain-containing protein [Ginsengibacter sp.]
MLQFQRLFPLIISIGFLRASKKVISENIKQAGSYPVMTLEHKLKGNWSIWGETEWRAADILKDFYYYEIKAGMHYKLKKNITLSAALGIYNTFEEGIRYDYASRKTEWRLWQQLNVKQNTSVIFPEHRIRIEEVITDNWKLNIRYRLQLKTPLNKATLTENAVYLSVYDEIFLRPENQLIRRNRFFGGLGWVVSESVTLQTGLLRQVDYRKNADDKGKNFLYLSTSLKL